MNFTDDNKWLHDELYNTDGSRKFKIFKDELTHYDIAPFNGGINTHTWVFSGFGTCNVFFKCAKCHEFANIEPYPHWLEKIDYKYIFSTVTISNSLTCQQIIMNRALK